MTDITQADREAAADWLSTKIYDWGYCGDVRSGKVEDHLVDAFAAHRLATQTAIAKMLDEMADKAATYERQMCLIEVAARVRGMP